MSYIPQPIVGKPKSIGGLSVGRPKTVGNASSAKREQLSVVNIFNSFDRNFANAAATNLAPILILGVSDPIPSGTPAGTAILRFIN